MRQKRTEYIFIIVGSFLNLVTFNILPLETIKEKKRVMTVRKEIENELLKKLY